MSAEKTAAEAKTIAWPSVITVLSAAILIGAEVFGAAFAGGWALAILFGLDDTAAHILQAVLFAIGVLIMVAITRNASSRSSSAPDARSKKRCGTGAKALALDLEILTSVHVCCQRSALRTNL